MNDYERMARVIRHLDESFHQQSSLEDLAAAAGLSPSYFQRLFSKLTGVTPKDFVQCLTAEHAKQMLREGASVLDAGLSGPGRLHDLCVTLEAASPGEVKNGGHGLTIQATDLAPPLLGSACWLKRCAEFARCHLSIPLSADLLKNAFRPSGRAPGFPAPTRPRTRSFRRFSLPSSPLSVR
ncbi:MAG: AraC family transcriptional regulator [Roseibacillus sp.]